MTKEWITKPVFGRIGEFGFRTGLDEDRFYGLLGAALESGAKVLRQRDFKMTSTRDETIIVEGSTVKCFANTSTAPVFKEGALSYVEDEVRSHGVAFACVDAFKEACLVEQIEVSTDSTGARLLFEIKRYDDGDNFFSMAVKSTKEVDDEVRGILRRSLEAAI
jgi:hypothetical protein